MTLIRRQQQLLESSWADALSDVGRDPSETQPRSEQLAVNVGQASRIPEKAPIGGTYPHIARVTAL